jgi:hypothetical protein
MGIPEKTCSGDRLGISDLDLQKSTLALLAGFGLVAVISFFYLFMRDKPGVVVGLSILLIILSSMMMLFFLLDKLRFCPASITDKSSNLIAGLLFGAIFFIIILSFTEWVEDAFDGFLIVVLTALTSFSVFLLFFSLFMED